MVRILDYASQTGRNRCYVNVIGSTPLGDYYLLKEEYKALDPTYYRDGFHWKCIHAMQLEFMRKITKQNKTLRCVYCGKDELKRTGKKKTLATVDHFFPKSYPFVNPCDKNNFVVACYTCNHDKGSLIYPLDSLKYLNHYKGHEEMLKNISEIKIKLNLVD